MKGTTMNKLKRFIDDYKYPIMVGLAGSAITMTLYAMGADRKIEVLTDVKDNYRDGMNLLGHTLLDRTDLDEDDITKMLQTVTPHFYRVNN